jgi:hypothetical protein
VSAAELVAEGLTLVLGDALVVGVDALVIGVASVIESDGAHACGDGRGLRGRLTMLSTVTLKLIKPGFFLHPFFFKDMSKRKYPK